MSESKDNTIVEDRKMLVKKELTEILNLDKTIEEFKTATEFKFIYLVYAVSKKSKYFSPYNFKIVLFKNINKHCFFTLSNEGMLSQIQNEVSFTSFGQFEEEYKLYKKIVKIPLFKYYLQWKCLHFWYKYILQNKYCRAKEELQGPLSLFMLSAPLRDASLKVYDLIYQSAAMSLYNGSVTEENTLQAFKEQQNALCIDKDQLKAEMLIMKNCINKDDFDIGDLVSEINKKFFPNLYMLLQVALTIPENSTETAIGHLQGLRLAVKNLVLAACSSVLAECGFTVDDSEFRVTKTSRIAQSRGSGGGSGITNYTMPFVKQRTKLKCCQRICRFIALMDFQLQSHLHKIVSNQIIHFEADVRRHYKNVPGELYQLNCHDNENVDNALENDKSSDDPKSPLFMLEVFLTKNGIEFDNTQSDYIAYVTFLMENWKWIVITHVPPLLDDIEFNDFTNPSICGNQNDQICSDGPSLQFVFDIDNVYQSYVEKILNYFTTNFEAVHKYLKRLEYVHIIYKENEDLDRESIVNETSIKNFQQMLEKYKQQITDVDKIKNTHMLGMFHLKLHLLKNIAKPTCEYLLDLVEKTLVKTGKRLVNELSNEIADSLKYLHTSPSTAAQYVDYKKFLENFSIRLDEINKNQNYIRELYDLAEKFDVPVPDEDIDNYDKFSNTLTTLQTAFEDINNEQDKLIEEFVKKINIHIKDMIQDVEQINTEANELWLTDINSNKEEVKLALSKLNNRLAELQEESILYESYQCFFQVKMTKFDILSNASEAVSCRILLWDSLDEWEKKMSIWEEDNFHNLEVEQMNTFLTLNLKYVMQFKKIIPVCKIVDLIDKKVQSFKEKMSIITMLRNPNLKDHHWIKLEHILGTKFPTNQSLTLIMLEKLGAFKYGSEIIDVSMQASSEATLEAMLKKVEDSWKTVNLIVLPYKNTNDIFILGSLEEVQVTLEEANINLNTLISSKNTLMIKSKIEDWINSMAIMNDVIIELNLCQKNWIYLESIFAAPDIQRQLPNEAKLFNQVNNSWKSIMQKVVKNPLAINICTETDLLKTLIKNNQQLEQILLYLEAYLESKRVVFPRFNFLANVELLEIIAQARDPRTVQPYMNKCFEAIWRIQFKNEDGEGKQLQSVVEGKYNTATDVIAMISSEREIVQFVSPIKATGNVEFWLSRVEKEMVNTLRTLMSIAIEDYNTISREEWVLLHADQLVIVVSQITWCRDVHEIFKIKSNVQESLIKFEQKCFKDLNNLTAMVRLGNLTKLQCSGIRALITVDFHARDVISTMIIRKINSDAHFEWLKQLRYYWDNVDGCVAYSINTRLLYAFEYLGSSPRLVITPLTDRCYLCLMGALQLSLGCALSGPTGTGKTETAKDLAKALATQCIVFNCSDGLNYKTIGRFFSGLAQSGVWCCFDEFDRVEIEVLSVIAQQLITITNAKLTNANKFTFEGREIRLIATCAVFITINPEYGRRNELPDNLQALFRPVAMMIPDYNLIAEVVLYSEGFQSSKILSHKIVKMYQMCNERLSIQKHYDFGMRAIKSVLIMAGLLKRENPIVEENLILIKALKDSNLPKFLKGDAVLFQDILNDLFPGVFLPENDSEIFLSTAKSVMESEGYQIKESFYIKVLHLFQTIVIRHGIITVGQTGSGKTTILKILSKTLTELYNKKIENQHYKPVNIYRLNPKAISVNELYGQLDLLTMEWKDGLLAKIIRKIVQVEKEEFQWVVCDGPLDTIWIENLNSVLDDSKILCLANSERIKLNPWVRMFFEVGDLSQASPAIVSRCGVVYVNTSDVGWLPYVHSWINRLQNDVIKSSTELKNCIEFLFKTYVNDGFSFINKYCLAPIKQVEISKATMMCTILESLLNDPASFDASTEISKVQAFIYQSFIFSYLWSLGSNLIDSSQIKFENFVFNQFSDKSEYGILPEMKLFNVYLNTENKKFENWNTIVQNFVYKTNTPYYELLVPTVDSIRYTHVMQKIVQMNQPVMLTGTTGVGKTSVANLIMQDLTSTGDWISATINLSAYINSIKTQKVLESKLVKKKRNRFGTPVNKRLALFIDDVNMPIPEVYGAQPPIELLRQILDFGGIYDRDKLDWNDIENMILCTICTPPGGGRNLLPPRFTRHFSIIYMPIISENSMRTIFTSILDGFLEKFPLNRANSSSEIVQASIEIYLRISEDLLPTPAKPHYIFNLRDFSKTIQGVLQANFITIPDKTCLYRLWYHETLRVYHDRLICQKDRSYIFNLLQDVCSRYFNTSVLDISKYTDNNPSHPPVLLFGDFMDPVSKESRNYKEIIDIDQLKTTLIKNLTDFNITYNKDMNIIFFMDAIEHITRIARILRSERGNALLVGINLVGKQSLTKLSSHLNAYKCFQIEVTKSYNHTDFREDLLNLYHNTGVKFEDTTFLFTDNQIVQEEFLEDISHILNSGEVPDLFKHNDLEKVITVCRPAALDLGIDGANQKEIFKFFIQRVRSKLHLVVSMSSIGDAFRRRCRLFPSLIYNSTIDWFDDWPTEVLLSVAHKSLEEFFGQQNNPKLVDSLTDICCNMHIRTSQATEKFRKQTARHCYVTLKSYLEFLKLYVKMQGSQTDKIKSDSDRISYGLRKLYETFDMVGDMKTKLKSMAPALLEKNEATSKLMEGLTREKASVDEVRKIVLVEETAAKMKASAAQEIAEDAQRDLTLAMPAMEAAKAALESLNKNDINELRLLSKPHKLVQTVMEAVCLLFGKKTDWTSAKTLLGDTNFLKALQEYDTDSISDKMINQLKPYIEDPDFNPQKVATQSKVAKSMCMWIRAVHSYSLVYRIVEPKRKRQQEAEDELNVVLKELRTKQKMLADVEERLQKLEDIYDQSVSEKNKLEMKIEQTQSRLSRSDLLVAALSDEQQRWENNLKTYSHRLLTITGDTIIAAGSISYLGPFTDEYRKEITLSWLQELTQHSVRHSPNYSLSYILVDPSELRSWNVYGLPQDSVSTDSMIIATRASRWPLIIDPQGQANKWIKGFEADNSLRICKVTDSNDNLTDTIVDAIRLGGPVLIEGLDEHIIPALKPVLENVTFLRDGRFFMRIGNMDVEYDNKFRFYMTTKISNPHYLPDVWIQVTIVNFMVTAKGLEDQLLVHVVRLERPDLEDKRTEINLSINKDNNLLKEMEDKTLKMLYISEGNILDDEELIDALNNNKESSIIVTGRLTDAEEMEKTVNMARERYRAIAKRGSCLYFVVAQLSKINTMYQFSLNYFNSIFCNAIKKSNKSLKIDVKIPTMIEDITMAIYTNISRGLFEHHKLIFSFLLSVNIHLQIGKITNVEWNFLLYGPIGITKIDVPKKPMVLALSEDAWTTVNYMSEVFPKFKSLPENCTRRIQIKLGNFVQDIHLDPANDNSVVNWDSILNPFEKLMVIRALKKEKLTCAISNFVSTELGKMFIESPEVSHRLLYTNTSSTLPLIYIISAGSDPFESFQKFSTEFKTIDKLHAISLGQDQGLIAEKLIKRGKEKGDWVFLQNCHLAPSWMPEMENLVQELIDNPLDVNQNFRLFLSSMPSEIFPTFVLQNSLKVAHEPPKGLRAKMKKSFADMNVDFFEDNDGFKIAFGSDWRKMVFGLCFFHAIILERKKFGSLGWNVPYMFTNSDHEYGMHLLQTYCLTANEIPWDALQYIMVEINYGGRVNNYWDQKTMKTIFLNFFDPRTLEPNYKYSESGIYFCPETENCTTINNYQAFINKLPLTEDLDIFGMHKNANIAYQTRETEEMLKTIIGAYSKSLTGVASKPDDKIVIDIADDISKRLINFIDFQQAHLTILKSDEKGRLSPLSTVLSQEIECFNTLLDVMHNSLTNLREAIKGHQIMSTELEEVYWSFVPTMWQNKTYPSLKTLGSWIKDLILRLDFINIWTKFGSPPSYWISGLFFPQGFITGCLQRHARKNSIPVYSLKIDFEVTSIVLTQEEISAVHATSLEENTHVYKGLTEREDGIYVHGLFLDAGRIDLDSKRLVDPIPGDLYSPLPVILLMPSIDIDTNSLRYNCPVYITTARAGVSLTTGYGANFPIGILLPTDFPENYWTLKGTALIAQITN